MFESCLKISKEVERGLERGLPVVALESTIIAHGMPYPKNLETALAVNAEVRINGAIPATIGIIKGQVIVGMSDEEIEYLATAENVLKVSRRDFPLVISEKLDGATTVAGTMIAAKMAGIKVFVTGGIGGVHRGACETFDISADLEELKNTDVTVVCAGVKSILDIPGTLEYLETAGVPVISYGTDEFPAFFSRTSGCKAECSMDDPERIGNLIKTKYDLGFKGGILVACPIPEKDEIPFGDMDAIIKNALKDCAKQGIKGKKITPFLLDKIKQLTKGESLEANISLVLNNAKIGSEIAKYI